MVDFFVRANFLFKLQVVLASTSSTFSIILFLTNVRLMRINNEIGYKKQNMLIFKIFLH